VSLNTVKLTVLLRANTPSHPLMQNVCKLQSGTIGFYEYDFLFNCTQGCILHHF